MDPTTQTPPDQPCVCPLCRHQYDEAAVEGVRTEDGCVVRACVACEVSRLFLTRRDGR